jgi:EpsI family protein
MTRFVPIAALVILAVGWASTYAVAAWRATLVLTPAEEAEIPTRLAAFPLDTENPTFHGTRDFVEPDTVALSGADHYVAIDYKDEDDGAVRLYVGAACRTDAWFHVPTVCLPAHGWTTSEAVKVPIWTDLPGVEADTDIWRMMLHRADQEMLVYYWFQYGDSIVTSRTERRMVRFQDLLAGKKDRPIQIVILYAPVGRELKKSEDRVESLVRTLWPQLFSILSSGD